MNRRMVCFTVGRILQVASALLLLPAVVSLIYRESCVWDFLITVVLAFGLGTILTLIAKPRDRVIYAKEGFIIVSVAWLAMSAIGALPFVFSGEIPSFTDAFFETVSGFTTTGASILDNVESLSHGILFWRSFTHWIGGMGVLVFVMAILPNVSDRSIHIMRAEMPGPIIGKLVPRARDTAKILYLIYIAMTAMQVVFLLCGGMPLFDSLIHTFGTAGTGGFGIKSDSIGSYSPYLQWVITAFMLLFGINFNLYYLLLIRRFRSAVKSSELWCYAGIVVVAIAVITWNISTDTSLLGDDLRNAAFQVSSIMTTTGYSTVDFNSWPQLSKTVLIVLMFIGGCAGSTAGGLKVSRVLILGKRIRRELRQMIHPRSVNSVQFEGKPVPEATLNNATAYFAIYFFIYFLILFLLSFEPFDFETNFSATAACFNNVGPGFSLVGPTSSYSCYSPFSKWVLSFAMLFGRLEIFPLILTLSPATWSKNK